MSHRTFKRNLTAATVDRASGEVWMALHNKLLHFDKDGNRLVTYLLYTPDSGRLEATSLVVTPKHILVGSDALGVFEFARPDKPEKTKTEKENLDSSAGKKSVAMNKFSSGRIYLF